MFSPSSDGRREWRLGWPAVCAGMVGSATSQIHFSSMGVFIRPISDSMGWNVATITFGIFICAILSVPGSPFIGWMAQRFGLARIVAVGIPVFFLAFASLGMLSHSRNEWIAGWIIVAIGSVFLKGNLWVLWVAQKFSAARGMAFAMMMAGSAILGIFVPIITQLLIETIGWRATYPTLAIALALMCGVACFLGCRKCPPARGERYVPPAALRSMPGDLTVRMAFRTRSFWQIGLISFLIGATLISLQVHLVPMFRAKGLDPRTAALMAGMFGGAALAGRIAGGLVLDRYSAKLIGMFSLLLPALACVLYLTLPLTPATGAAIAILFGFGVGAEGDVLGYISSRYFGVRSFGTIYGFTQGLFSLGAGVGPLAMALMLDHFGTYQLVMVIMFVALSFCALLFVTLGAYPALQRREDPDNPAQPRGTPETHEPATAGLRGAPPPVS